MGGVALKISAPGLVKCVLPATGDRLGYKIGTSYAMYVLGLWIILSLRTPQAAKHFIV